MNHDYKKLKIKNKSINTILLFLDHKLDTQINKYFMLKVLNAFNNKERYLILILINLNYQT